MKRKRPDRYSSWERIVLSINQLTVGATILLMVPFLVAPYFDQTTTLLQATLRVPLITIFIYGLFFICFLLVFPYWTLLAYSIYVFEIRRKMSQAYLSLSLFAMMGAVLLFLVYVKICMWSSPCFLNPVINEGIGFYGLFYLISVCMFTFPVSFFFHRWFRYSHEQRRHVYEEDGG